MKHYKVRNIEKSKPNGKQSHRPIITIFLWISERSIIKLSISVRVGLSNTIYNS